MASAPVIILLLCGVFAAQGAVIIQQLQHLNIKEQPLSISGFGSGATMATQMQVAFSSSFAGAALFSAVWYRCAPRGQSFEHTDCNTGKYNVSRGINDARKYSVVGDIDDLRNLRKHRVYHHIQRNDEIVRPEVRGKTRKFYESVGVKAENFLIKYQAGYFSMPTTNKSEIPCLQLVSATESKRGLDPVGTSYCNYFGAFEGLNYVLQNSLDRPAFPSKLELQPLILFNQVSAIGSASAEYMDEIGFLYIPSGCRSDGSKCKLHVVLHGCKGYRKLIKSQFVKRSGYLQVAEVNNIVMLFPQSKPFDENPDGCWDVFGATGHDYATQSGPQMQAIASMINKIFGTEKLKKKKKATGKPTDHH